MPNKTTKKKTKKTKTKTKTTFDELIACEKKYCKKELRMEEQQEKQNRKLVQKCNYDENMNDKYDAFNKVKITYDFNPLHFPFNRRKTSPCMEHNRRVLNNPKTYMPMRNCTRKNCKKEHKRWLHRA